jgi:hypothetical protein
MIPRKVVASCGWGLNSVWMIVRAIESGEPPDVVLFEDTGCEHEDTYCIERWYVENVFTPAGVEYVRLSPWATPEWYDKRLRGSKGLLAFCQERRIVPLGAARWCSADFKARPGDRWMLAHGVTEAWLGFTVEEDNRVRRRGVFDPDAALLPEQYRLPFPPDLLPAEDAPETKPWVIRAPLWEAGQTREHCIEGLRDLGYIVPDKSGCIICPFRAGYLVRAARAGDPQARAYIDIIIGLELAASEAAERPVGILPTGGRVVDLMASPELDLGDVDYSTYRPCECGL